MKVCLTNTLQPCFLEAGWEGIWTPRLNCRHGGCEERCNVCGSVCPTQAIRALPIEEKRFAKIGTAVIDRTRCIAWAQQKECLICDEACPYNAIDFRVVADECGTGKRPFVGSVACVGCGLCEQKCPVAGESAIVVHADGEMRLESGSYVTEEALRAREPEADANRDYFEIWEGTGECPSPLDEVEDLPPGFLIEARARGDPPTPPTGPAHGRAPVPVDTLKPRFGFTVSKKLGNAVVRNRIKRRLRAVVSELAESFAEPSFDYVIVARRAALNRPFVELRTDMKIAFNRLRNVAAKRSRAAKSGAAAKSSC